MTASRDPDRLIHQFLLEGEELLADQVYDTVRAEIDRKRQRVVIGPWRTPTMNRIVGFGLAAAAVVVAILIGAQFLASPANVGGPGLGGSSPTPQPTAEPTPSPTAESGLPQGPFVVTGADDPVQVTVSIASSGWMSHPQIDAVSKNDDGLAPAESVGVYLLAWTWPAGTGFNVYGDPCQWSSTIPETPATTADEIAAALAAQPSRDATAPEDVTLGGYSGKQVTLHVPDDIAVDAAGEFADCDQTRFASYGTVGDDEPGRFHQGPSQVDDLWILDVDGAIVILDAVYGPAVPADLVEEVRTLAESATFEAP